MSSSSSDNTNTDSSAGSGSDNTNANSNTGSGSENTTDNTNIDGAGGSSGPLYNEEQQRDLNALSRELKQEDTAEMLERAGRSSKDKRNK